MSEDEAIARIRIERQRSFGMYEVKHRYRVRDVGGNNPRVISEHTDKDEAMRAWEDECRKLMGE